MSLIGNGEPNWKIVLELLYENEITIKSTEAATVETDMLGAISDETKLSERELLDGFRYLKSVDLVYMREDRIDDEIITPGGLTNEGLQLAHQIKTERQRRITNIILVFLTAVLTVLTIGLLGVELAPMFMIFY